MILVDKYARKSPSMKRYLKKEVPHGAKRDCMTSTGKLKRAFPTKREALKSKGAKAGLRPYQCRFCNQWHLTKQQLG